MGLRLPKKHPRNKVLPVALAEVELNALQLEAKRQGIGTSTLVRNMLLSASLPRLVEKYFGIDRSALDARADHD